MAESDKINEMVKNALESIKSFADTSTIFGEQIKTESGTVIIPISKVSVGFATGGVDYFGKNAAASANAKMQNFGGGGGTGVTVSPVGFLIVKASGDVQMLNIKTNEALNPDGDVITTVNTIIEKAPGAIKKIKSFFKKDNDEEDAEADKE